MNEVSEVSEVSVASEKAVPLSGAPYRTPPDHEMLAFYKPPRPRLVLGPALQTYALLLWSYVVVGQLTTSFSASTPLGEGKAVFFVIAITAAAWITSVRRSQRVAPSSPTRLVLRAMGILAAAGAAFFGSVLAATVFAVIAGRVDVPVLVVFLLLAATAWLKGRRVLEPESAPLTQNERAVLVGVGMVVVLVTVIAGADLATSG